MRSTVTLTLLALFAFPAFAQTEKIQECVIENGILKTIDAEYNKTTGERWVTINGNRKKFADVYPSSGPGYAGTQDWFINNGIVQFGNKKFRKYGLPRVLGATEIEKKGEYKAVGVYLEAGLKGPIEVIYIPSRQGCEFQPYVLYCGDVTIEKTTTTATTMQLNATISDIPGKISYTWSSDDVKIVKGQGTPMITVDIKDKKENDVFGITLKVNEGKECPVISTPMFAIHR